LYISRVVLFKQNDARDVQVVSNIDCNINTEAIM